MLRIYKEKRKLNDPARKILVDSIVDWHIKNNIEISRDNFENIAEDIEETLQEDRVK